MMKVGCGCSDLTATILGKALGLSEIQVTEDSHAFV